MVSTLDKLPVASILAVVVSLVGGVVAVTHPETLSFAGYCKNVGIFVAGTGVLGLARSAANKG